MDEKYEGYRKEKLDTKVYKAIRLAGIFLGFWQRVRAKMPWTKKKIRETLVVVAAFSFGVGVLLLAGLSLTQKNRKQQDCKISCHPGEHEISRDKCICLPPGEPAYELEGWGE